MEGEEINELRMQWAILPKKLADDLAVFLGKWFNPVVTHRPNALTACSDSIPFMMACLPMRIYTWKYAVLWTGPISVCAAWVPYTITSLDFKKGMDAKMKAAYGKEWAEVALSFLRLDFAIFRHAFSCWGFICPFTKEEAKVVMSTYAVCLTNVDHMVIRKIIEALENCNGVKVSFIGSSDKYGAYHYGDGWKSLLSDYLYINTEKRDARNSSEMVVCVEYWTRAGGEKSRVMEIALNFDDPIRDAVNNESGDFWTAVTRGLPGVWNSRLVPHSPPPVENFGNGIKLRRKMFGNGIKLSRKMFGMHIESLKHSDHMDHAKATGNDWQDSATGPRAPKTAGQGASNQRANEEGGQSDGTDEGEEGASGGFGNPADEEEDGPSLEEVEEIIKSENRNPYLREARLQIARRAK